jgi:hypothetical protein
MKPGQFAPIVRLPQQVVRTAESRFGKDSMFRMTSFARYFSSGVGSSRPSWRWIMCFLERLNSVSNLSFEPLRRLP